MLRAPFCNPSIRSSAPCLNGSKVNFLFLKKVFNGFWVNKTKIMDKLAQYADSEGDNLLIRTHHNKTIIGKR